MVDQDDSEQFWQIGISIVGVESGHIEFKGSRDVSIFFLMIFDEIDDSLDFSMDIVVIWCIEVSPKNIFFVEHEFKELDQEMIFCCIDFIDCGVNLLSGFAVIFQSC